MSFNGSGTYSRPSNSFSNPTTGQTISSTAADALFDDMETAIGGTIQKDGQCVMTGQFKAANGTVGAPSYTFGTDLDCGLYRIGADNIGVAVGGAVALNISGGSITTSVNFTPATNDGAALGSASLGFADAHLASGGVINWANGDVTITHATNLVTFSGASSGWLFNETIAPATNDGAALGTTARGFSDGFFASGAVLNFDNGDVTITHSANALAFAGGSAGYTFDATIAGSNITLTGYVDQGEIATPSNPAANVLRVFAKDVSGRTVRHVIDNSGREVPVGAPQLLGYAVGVDFNAVADTSIVLDVPYGEWRLSVVGIANTGATASLTTAQYGLFSAAGGGGTALVASGTAMSGLTSATVNANGSYMQTAAAVSARLNLTTVHFRITQAQGAAASGNVYIIGFYLPNT
jgi:hypothetical protein